MSFTKLNYDPCTYRQDLGQSMSIGRYRIDQPFNKDACFYEDPTVRLQKYGGASCIPEHLVDLDSEMLGIHRPASKCPDKLFPYNEFKCVPQLKSACPPNRQFWSEDTRLSNPPCTLRCTGWNRWNWLPCNPQDKALVPFPTNTNTDLLFKDNHRPLIPVPIDQETLMNNQHEPNWTEKWVAGRPHMEISTTWRSCDEVRCL